jgi:hypothetical protein
MGALEGGVEPFIVSGERGSGRPMRRSVRQAIISAAGQSSAHTRTIGAFCSFRKSAHHRSRFFATFGLVNFASSLVRLLPYRMTLLAEGAVICANRLHLSRPGVVTLERVQWLSWATMPSSPMA